MCARCGSLFSEKKQETRLSTIIRFRATFPRILPTTDKGWGEPPKGSAGRRLSPQQVGGAARGAAEPPRVSSLFRCVIGNMQKTHEVRCVEAPIPKVFATVGLSSAAGIATRRTAAG